MRYFRYGEGQTQGTDGTGKDFGDTRSDLYERYGFCEPHMVAKCYESSDPAFSKRSVYIFTYGNELRIIAAPGDGISSYDDLGCHAFLREDLFIGRKLYVTADVTALISGDTYFYLGIRAKKFIEKNFIFKGIDT